MRESEDPTFADRILAAKQAIDNPDSSPFDVYCARQVLRDLGADSLQAEQDRQQELWRLQGVAANPSASPLDRYAAGARIIELGVTASSPHSNQAPKSPMTTQPRARSYRGRGIMFRLEFWQIYFACFAMGIIFMLAGGGAEPINFGRYGEIDGGGEHISLLGVIVGSAIIAAACCWLFDD